jgi:hypothetical protein
VHQLTRIQSCFPCTSCFPRIDQAKEEGVSRSEIGSMPVNVYVTKFTQLSCYAPHEVDIDKKKQDYFLNGLTDGLAYALEAQDIENFQGMVNKALVLENCRGVMEQKHKLVHQHQSGNSSQPHDGTSSAGPTFCPTQPQSQLRLQTTRQGFCTPQCHVIQRPNNIQTPTVGNQSVQRIQATQDLLKADRRCYNYGEKGHYASRCPNPCTCANQTATATPAPTDGANSILVAAKQNYACGRVVGVFCTGKI